ncbi:hypothetical protein ABW19_dt0210143 [Dactylella cylindrospora]|nr:hypothetical protein ABW19_dt0210143 [Dactylella cylindrospora]
MLLKGFRQLSLHTFRPSTLIPSYMSRMSVPTLKREIMCYQVTTHFPCYHRCLKVSETCRCSKPKPDSFSLKRCKCCLSNPNAIPPFSLDLEDPYHHLTYRHLSEKDPQLTLQDGYSLAILSQQPELGGIVQMSKEWISRSRSGKLGKNSPRNLPANRNEFRASASTCSRTSLETNFEEVEVARCSPPNSETWMIPWDHDASSAPPLSPDSMFLQSLSPDQGSERAEHARDRRGTDSKGKMRGKGKEKRLVRSKEAVRTPVDMLRLPYAEFVFEPGDGMHVKQAVRPDLQTEISNSSSISPHQEAVERDSRCSWLIGDRGQGYKQGNVKMSLENDLQNGMETATMFDERTPRSWFTPGKLVMRFYDVGRGARGWVNVLVSSLEDIGSVLRGRVSGTGT